MTGCTKTSALLVSPVVVHRVWEEVDSIRNYRKTRKNRLFELLKHYPQIVIDLATVRGFFEHFLEMEIHIGHQLWSHVQRQRKRKSGAVSA